MLLTTPTFNIEILPNALAALPELFIGLDEVLPALDIQLEEVWSGTDGHATEVLITASIKQAIHDSRPVFLVDPEPDATELAKLLDTGRSTRWVAKNTPKSVWVDSFARFLFTLRIDQKTQFERNSGRVARAAKTLAGNKPGNRRKAS